MLIHLVMSSNSKDLIQKIVLEAGAYKSMDMIESLIEGGMDLSQVPVQPLYQAIKSLHAGEVAELLPRLSKEQRQAFLDLDLWFKDDLDVAEFGSWVEVYTRSKDEDIVQEFVQGNPFALYLKGVFNVWTFDVEDPVYPEHDHYFLTEDNLLLFEFHEDYQYINEVRDLVKKLYTELGVEKAYAHLFKILVDSYMIIQEDEYEDKCYRLKELGFVSHLEALEIHNSFPSRAVLDNFIKKKSAQTATIEIEGRSQTLPENSLVAFKNEIPGISEDLSRVEDQRRQDYLHFNFLRMINSGLTIDNAMKSGGVAMTRVGNRTRSLLELGYDYIRDQIGNEQSVFELFDFTDIFRVGNSLVSFVQKNLKKGMTATALSRQDGFLGRYWVDYIDNSFDFPIKYVEVFGSGSKPQAITNSELFLKWERRSETLIGLLPFADQFFLNYRDLLEANKIRDEFYLNYKVDEIDLESILMSTFANFALGNFEKENVNRIGLSLDEYKTFAIALLDDEGKVSTSTEMGEKIAQFIKNFGMENVVDLDHYILGILTEQMEGYDYKNLSKEDFKHVGGPIILFS